VQQLFNGTNMHNSFGTTAGMLNGEDPDSQNPTLGTEFYTNGESFGNGSTIQPMNNVSGNIWNNTNIRPDDIYPEIFFVPTDISYTNAPEEITIDRSHYHLLKFTNPYTMVDNSNFFIEFNTIPVSSNSAIDLQVYIVGKNRGISFFERSDWRNSPDVEMVGTISKDDNYHHIHSENSKHHLIRLSTNTDRTIGNKHIDISENFWIVLMASTPSAIRSWKLRYHDKSKNNGRDNDGLTNQSLSETDATWFTGNEKNRTTSPLSGLPDAHIHIARSGNSTTGVGVNLDSPTPSVIPSGHSFWIKVNQGYSSSVFPFTKNSRVKNSNSYLKSASLPKYESVRIISHSGLLEDEIALVDVKDASQGVDIYDAEKFLGNDENVLEVFSLISDKKLSINSQPLSEETTIPLGVSCKSSGIYSISLRSNQTDFTVLLKDSLINKIVNLSSSGSYEFEITQSGVKLDRFYVTFLKSVATHVEDSSDSRDIIAYSENGGIWVKKSDNFEKVRFSVYSINGGLAKKGVLIGNNPIFIGQFPTGVYTLAFQSSDNTQLNSVKLLVAKK